MTIKQQIRPYIPPERKAAQYRAIELAYKQAVSRYIAKLVNGSKAA